MFSSISDFSELYTGTVDFFKSEFIQTCYFCGTQSVPFIMLNKKVGRFLSYFIFVKEKSLALTRLLIFITD